MDDDASPRPRPMLRGGPRRPRAEAPIVKALQCARFARRDDRRRRQRRPALASRTSASRDGRARHRQTRARRRAGARARRLRRDRRRGRVDGASTTTSATPSAVVAVHIPIAGFSLASALLGLGRAARAGARRLPRAGDRPGVGGLRDRARGRQNMRRPPRRPDALVFTAARLGRRFVAGLPALAATLFSVHRARAGARPWEAQRAGPRRWCSPTSRSWWRAAPASALLDGPGRREPRRGRADLPSPRCSRWASRSRPRAAPGDGAPAPAALGEAAAPAVFPVLALDAPQGLRRPSAG